MTPSGPSPVVSVLIPVFNAAPYLASALASVQAQTFADFEIIAVDDGSTDGSSGILDRIAASEPRLRVIRRPNTGIVGALNDGLAATRGEFIARMDADDLCLPERFARQLEYLRRHPDCVCVGSAFRYIDDMGSHLKECRRQTAHDAIERDLLTGDGGAIIHPAAMFRRDAVVRAGAYREAAQWVEDLDLYLRLARVGRLANLEGVLLYYRLHVQSVNYTRNHGRHERKVATLAAAHAARGLAFDASRHPAPSAPARITADDLRDFAITALQFGRDGRPWRYALRALRTAPAEPASWRTLWYIFKHRVGLINARPDHPCR